MATPGHIKIYEYPIAIVKLFKDSIVSRGFLKAIAANLSCSCGPGNVLQALAASRTFIAGIDRHISSITDNAPRPDDVGFALAAYYANLTAKKLSVLGSGYEYVYKYLYRFYGMFFKDSESVATSPLASGGQDLGTPSPLDSLLSNGFDASEFLDLLRDNLPVTMSDMFMARVSQELQCTKCPNGGAVTSKSTTSSLPFLQCAAGARSIQKGIEKMFADDTVQARCDTCAANVPFRKLEFITMPPSVVVVVVNHSTDAGDKATDDLEEVYIDEFINLAPVVKPWPAKAALAAKAASSTGTHGAGSGVAAPTGASESAPAVPPSLFYDLVAVVFRWQDRREADESTLSTAHFTTVSRDHKEDTWTYFNDLDAEKKNTFGNKTVVVRGVLPPHGDLPSSAQRGDVDTHKSYRRAVCTAVYEPRDPRSIEAVRAAAHSAARAASRAAAPQAHVLDLTSDDRTESGMPCGIDSSEAGAASVASALDATTGVSQAAPAVDTARIMPVQTVTGPGADDSRWLLPASCKQLIISVTYGDTERDPDPLLLDLPELREKGHLDWTRTTASEDELFAPFDCAPSQRAEFLCQLGSAVMAQWFSFQQVSVTLEAPSVMFLALAERDNWNCPSDATAGAVDAQARILVWVNGSIRVWGPHSVAAHSVSGAGETPGVLDNSSINSNIALALERYIGFIHTLWLPGRVANCASELFEVPLQPTDNGDWVVPSSSAESQAFRVIFHAMTCECALAQGWAKPVATAGTKRRRGYSRGTNSKPSE
jgi:hypothetical protein